MINNLNIVKNFNMLFGILWIIGIGCIIASIRRFFLKTFIPKRLKIALIFLIISGLFAVTFCTIVIIKYYHFMNGKYYFGLQNYDKAIYYYKEAIKINSKHTVAYHNLAFAYAHKGMYDKAIEYEKKAIKINPKFKASYIGLETIWNMAVGEYKEKIEINPYDIKTRFKLSIFYNSKNMHDEAIAECKKMMEIDPSNISVHYVLSCCYSGKGKVDEAIKELKTFKKLNKNWVLVRELIREDPSFKNIKQDKRFIELIEDRFGDKP